VTRAIANGNGKWDLQAAAAEDGAANEAAREPFPFAYKGQDYSIPPMTDWPVSALRSVGRGDFDGALPDLLGAEAYEALCDAGLTVGELTTLFDKVAAEAGMESLGNSAPARRRSSTRR
jgi:hypothetical protein